MSVYVDPLHVWGGDTAPRCFRHKPSCHMYADSLKELHAMALRIGLKLEWFQDNVNCQHYDLTPSKRALAVRYGAIEHDRYEAVDKWKELRGKRKSTAATMRRSRVGGLRRDLSDTRQGNQ